MALQLILFSLWFSVTALASPLKIKTLLTTENQIRVGIQNPAGEPIGDILFLTGFGDRLDNHGPLFEEWNQKGFRVISFDYPSHGETNGAPINFFTFRKLAKLVQNVEAFTRENANRPLLLSGWSTGGMLAARIAAADTLARPSRPLKALILFAPAISTPLRVGDRSSWLYPTGRVTTETLTHNPNPPHKGPIQPETPLSAMPFPIFLKINTLFALNQPLPAGLPTLVFMTDPSEERYINIKGVRHWLKWQERFNAEVKTIEVLGARHEIDNESNEFGGDFVRHKAAEFAARAVSSAPCESALIRP